jgi:predicted enzyme related to lactoylglutathione lyase
MSKETLKQGDFCWNELMTSDTQSAAKFYADLFGWKTQEHQMEDCLYAMFKNGDKEMGGMMQTPAEMEEQIPPHWMSYIAVDDLDAMLKKAMSLGAVVKVPAKQAGAFGRLAVLQDPTGAHIAL